MCSYKQVCNGELPLLHHNCGNYRKPSLTNVICGQNLAWGPPFFIAFLKTTQNFLQVGYLIYSKSMREKYGLNLYLSLTPPCFSCLLIHVATSFQTSLSQTHDLSAGICSFEQARNKLELLSKATPRQKVLLFRGFLLIKTLSHVGSGRCCSWEVNLYII